MYLYHPYREAPASVGSFTYTTNQSEIGMVSLEQMNSIRFATAIRQFSKERGGMERYLVGLCDRMVEEGFEVHVYTERWNEENPKIHFHRVRTISFPKSLRLLSFAVKATREIEKGDYDVSLGVGHTLRADVFQPHGGVHWAWFWRSLQAYDHRVLWILRFLGRILNPGQWASGWIEGAPFRQKKPPKVIAISDMVKEDILRWYAIPEEKITVIYNGVDLERFSPENRKYRNSIRKRHRLGEEKIILFVSNNFRMKGLGYLMEALALLKKEGSLPLKLLVMGRDRKAPFLRLAVKLGILDEVLFVGSTTEPEKYYGAADLLAHPTFYDACSLTVIEALSSGLPVLTSSANGASGIAQSGERVRVIEDPKKVDQMSQAIRDLLVEGGSPVRSRVESFSEERNYRQMSEVFRQVARGQGG